MIYKVLNADGTEAGTLDYERDPLSKDEEMVATQVLGHPRGKTARCYVIRPDGTKAVLGWGHTTTWTVIEEEASESDIRYIFAGSDEQLDAMEAAMREVDLPVLRQGRYLGFREADRTKFGAALIWIFDKRINGWWLQQNALIEHKVCTEAQFEAAYYAGLAALERKPPLGEVVPLHQAQEEGQPCRFCGAAWPFAPMDRCNGEPDNPFEL